jgi:hypothetical protein
LSDGSEKLMGHSTVEKGIGFEGGVRSACSGTVSTGHIATRSTLSVVEPNMKFPTPLTPRGAHHDHVDTRRCRMLQDLFDGKSLFNVDGRQNAGNVGRFEGSANSIAKLLTLPSHGSDVFSEEFRRACWNSDINDVENSNFSSEPCGKGNCIAKSGLRRLGEIDGAENSFDHSSSMRAINSSAAGL